MSGTAVHPVNYQYGVDANGYYTAQIFIKTNSGTIDTNEWVKTYQDMLGRSYMTVYSGASSNSYTLYNNIGQRYATVDPDGVTTLFAYNGKGEQTYSVVDSNQNQTIDFTGSGDRITFTTNDVTFDNSANVNRTRVFVWSSSANSSNITSQTETSVEGLTNWSSVYNSGTPVTTVSVTSYNPTFGYKIVTTTNADNSYTISTNQYGRLISTTRFDANTNQIGQTLYGYDTFGRQVTVTDARNGTSTNFFDNANNIIGTATPVPASGLSSQVTSNFFDDMSRLTGTLLPDITSVTNYYTLTSQLQQTSGSRTYPVGYGYDAQGRMTAMTNWTNFASLLGGRVTIWTYDDNRGFLTGKIYEGGTEGPSYTYTDGGRLQTRVWARGITTTYSYDGAGDLSGVNYSDGTTPNLSYNYDRRGRQTVITQGAIVCTLAYTDANLLLSESYSGGPLDGVSVTNSYDSLLRRTNNVTLHGGMVLSIITNNYDAASRLNLVSDGTNSASYTYLGNSPLVNQIAYAHSGTTEMTTVKIYDYLNRLTLIYSSNATYGVLDSHNYGYNNANQRTTMTNADNSYWNFTYDGLGQVTAGSNYWGDGSIVAGRQFGYTFDNIGNRTTTAIGGDASGNNLRSANYAANNLNQYTSRTVPGYLEIEGSATNAATVSVNGQSAYRKTNYYWSELTVANSSSPVLQQVTNMAILPPGPNGTIIGSTFVPQTPETFTYDADGNLTSDGRWTNTWDAENRLINVTSLSSGPEGSLMEINFNYDYKGRRVQKLVSTNNGSSYLPKYTNNFAYDGWNLLVVLTPAYAVTNSFMWGSDLAGSMNGAGGVAGLLETTVNKTNCFVAFDGNGNVTVLANSANGTVLAQYEYSPFGEILRATGSLAKANPFRFSTKYADDETVLLYYGYRYYSPELGRWLNRDLIPNNEGPAAYAVLGNDPQTSFDFLGLWKAVEGGNAYEQSVVIRAEEDASQVLQIMNKQLPELVGTSTAFKLRYPALFGVTVTAGAAGYDPQGFYYDWYTGIMNGIPQIIDRINANSTTAHICSSVDGDCSGCLSPYTVASTHKATYDIYFCCTFFKEIQNGNYLPREVVVHEYSHAVLGTVDDLTPSNPALSWPNLPKYAYHWGALASYDSPTKELDWQFGTLIPTAARNAGYIH